ncbi:hypothetical protein ACHAXS_011364 [Conticribra weissflogii]
MLSDADVANIETTLENELADETQCATIQDFFDDNIDNIKEDAFRLYAAPSNYSSARSDISLLPGFQLLLGAKELINSVKNESSQVINGIKCYMTHKEHYIETKDEHSSNDVDNGSEDSTSSQHLPSNIDKLNNSPHDSLDEDNQSHSEEMECPMIPTTTIDSDDSGNLPPQEIPCSLHEDDLLWSVNDHASSVLDQFLEDAVANAEAIDNALKERQELREKSRGVVEWCSIAMHAKSKNGGGESHRIANLFLLLQSKDYAK